MRYSKHQYLQIDVDLHRIVTGIARNGTVVDVMRHDSEVFITPDFPKTLGIVGSGIASSLQSTDFPPTPTLPKKLVSNGRKRFWQRVRVYQGSPYSAK